MLDVAIGSRNLAPPPLTVVLCNESITPVTKATSALAVLPSVVSFLAI